MVNLKGRSIEIVGYGSPRANEYTLGARLGEVIEDRGEQVVVYCPNEDSTHYIAKYRLLTNEYEFGAVPEEIGVYLIQK